MELGRRKNIRGHHRGLRAFNLCRRLHNREMCKKQEVPMGLGIGNFIFFPFAHHFIGILPFIARRWRERAVFAPFVRGWRNAWRDGVMTGACPCDTAHDKRVSRAERYRDFVFEIWRE